MKFSHPKYQGTRETDSNQSIAVFRSFQWRFRRTETLSVPTLCFFKTVNESCAKPNQYISNWWVLG